MSSFRFAFICACFLACVLPRETAATVAVPSLFSDHMVLQQDLSPSIWGNAEPGEEISVTFVGETRKTCADPQGKWKIILPAPSAAGPFAMTIQGQDNCIEIHDILMGDVWVGSGQSNMEMPVWNTKNAPRELLRANRPQIRLFTVSKHVSREPLDECEGKWFVCTPQSASWFSAVLYYFGRDLNKALHCPIGLIHSSWSGTPAESWVSRSTLESSPNLTIMLDQLRQEDAEYPAALAVFAKEMADWTEAANRAEARGGPAPEKPKGPDNPDNHWREAGLYNGMIHPLTQYAIRGVIWYQGESNAERAYQYRTLFPALIHDWRAAWGQGDFPFLFVQLANFKPRLDQPGPAQWAELREAQVMALDLPNTGMAVAIDIGEADDIHPKNKQAVAERLALNALTKTYGKRIEYSGPVLESMKTEGNKAILTFSHAKGLKAKNGPVKGFAVAGADQHFVWADAAVKGNTVIVSSSEVTNPVAVRYGWADNPECNLYNSAGLPASPFRTDNWPGITFDKQ